MVWEETHVPKVVGSNPSTVYWMDIYSHSFVVKLFEKTKMNEKRPGSSPILCKRKHSFLT